MNQKNLIIVPADVPLKMQQKYIGHYQSITSHDGKILLFATDQKIEHLNYDFYGPAISPEAQDPEHLFKIAALADIGAMASHLGLIARYGNQYPTINYIVKLNAKTNLIKQADPISKLLWTVDDVMCFKEESNLKIRGIGYTLYLGSEFEPEMIQDAAQVIFEAHQHGLIAILWCYLRGKAIINDQDPELIAGAAGIAASLGADFVKIKPPLGTNTLPSPTGLKRACMAAGTTKVICSGGEKIDQDELLQKVREELAAGTAGCAMGRNIFQRSLPGAIALTQALSSLIYK